jgi:hypothetical protein
VLAGVVAASGWWQRLVGLGIGLVVGRLVRIIII